MLYISQGSHPSTLYYALTFFSVCDTIFFKDYSSFFAVSLAPGFLLCPNFLYIGCSPDFILIAHSL